VIIALIAGANITDFVNQKCGKAQKGHTSAGIALESGECDAQLALSFVNKGVKESIY
jgi:hypothetical protein